MIQRRKRRLANRIRRLLGRPMIYAADEVRVFIGGIECTDFADVEFDYEPWPPEEWY